MPYNVCYTNNYSGFAITVTDSVLEGYDADIVCPDGTNKTVQARGTARAAEREARDWIDKELLSSCS